MTSFPIDLDSETIQYEGRWYTRDELARRIKSMLDAGDFAIGKPSNALEHLTHTIQSLRTLAFRVTPEMADAINQAAARQGLRVGALIREALGAYVGGQPKAQEAERPANRPPSPTGRRATEPEIPIPQLPPTPLDVKAAPPAPVPHPPTVSGAPKATPPQVSSPTVVIESPELLVEEVSPEESQ